ERHVIAQVVKTVFVIGAVGDVSRVSFTLRWCWHIRQVNAYRQAEELKQRTVVFGVTLRQIVVDGNHVHTFTAQGVQVSRQGRGQSFTVTGTHFGDAAFVEHHTAQQLYVKVTHAEYAFTGFTDLRKGFRDQAFNGFALFQACTEFTG